MSQEPVLLDPVVVTAAANDIAADRVTQLVAYLESLKGMHELHGSNRGPQIDEWAKEFGSPLGSPWCALTQGHARKKFGLWIPTHDVGSCDEWVLQAKKAGKWSTTPVLGAVAVYTNHKPMPAGRYAGQLDAVHVGGVVSLTPLVDIEGNTSDEAGFNRDGGCVAKKPVNVSRLYGYVLP